MENSGSINFMKSAFMIRKKPSKRAIFSEKMVPGYDDHTTSPKSSTIKRHIKWADDLEEVKTFRKNPSDKRVALLQKRAKKASKICGKSILRKHFDDDEFSVTSDTEASSTWTGSECSTPLRMTVYRTSQKAKPLDASFDDDFKNRSFTKGFRPEDKDISRLTRRYRLAMEL